MDLERYFQKKQTSLADIPTTLEEAKLLAQGAMESAATAYRSGDLEEAELYVAQLFKYLKDFQRLGSGVARQVSSAEDVSFLALIKPYRDDRTIDFIYPTKSHSLPTTETPQTPGIPWPNHVDVDPLLIMLSHIPRKQDDFSDLFEKKPRMREHPLKSEFDEIYTKPKPAKQQDFPL